MNIAIVGATGNVGRKILEVLEKKELAIDNLYLLASSRSAGSKINFNGKEHEVIDLETFDFSKVKITFFAAGGKISENFAVYLCFNTLRYFPMRFFHHSYTNNFSKMWGIAC